MEYGRAGLARKCEEILIAANTWIGCALLRNIVAHGGLAHDPAQELHPGHDRIAVVSSREIARLNGRRHARIWRDGDVYKVEDLGSVNGTVINDVIRLKPRQPRPLDSGDRIKLGETTLHFLMG